MEHVVTFLLLLSLMFSVALSTMTFVFQKQFHHRASSWFGVVTLGLGCFVMEILVYRYGIALNLPVIVQWSNLGAVAGALMLAVALPRLARLLSGIPKQGWWWLGEIAVPVATAVACLAFLVGLGGQITVFILQILVFGTVLGSVLFLALKRPRSSDKKGGRFGLRLAVWSALCLPLIILDALGGILPRSLNDLPLVVYLPGLFLIFMGEVSQLFGTPPFLNAGAPSSYFLERFEISNREAEVLTLALEGVSNTDIGSRLFISPKTVENHLTSIFRKTGVKNRVQLYRLVHSSSD